MHVYVQKLTRTTRPRRPSAVSGGVFRQPVAPPNDGKLSVTSGPPKARLHRRAVFGLRLAFDRMPVTFREPEGLEKPRMTAADITTRPGANASRPILRRSCG